MSHTMCFLWLVVYSQGNLEILVSSYYCSSYGTANPCSSLGTFSSSFIGYPELHSVDGCEPNADTIVDIKKYMQTGVLRCFFLRDFARAWQIQRWMLTVNHCTDHGIPSGGKDWRSWRSVQPYRKNNNINQPELPESKPSTKEYTWRDPWLQP